MESHPRKEHRYWQYRLYKSNYNPQLALRGNIPGYNRDYLSNRLDDGTIVYQSRQQLNSSLNLGLNQPIALTGGNISVNTDLNYFNDLQEDIIRYNSTLVNIRLDQPLFGFNELKWDKLTEPLRYEESKRSYVEELEFVSRESVRYFFDYLDAQINYQIAESNLHSNDTIYKIEEGRYNIGTTSKDKLLQVELQLLRSQQDVVQSQLDLQTSSQKLRAYLAFKSSDTLELILPTEIPDFDISMQDALLYAKMNRADYTAFERRRLEADRAVAEARRQRFQTNLSVSFGLNSAGDTFDESYMDPNQQQRLDVGLIVPILDWGRSASQVKLAESRRELVLYDVEKDKINFERQVIVQVEQFSLLKDQLATSYEADKVAENGYQIAQKKFQNGEISITDLNISLAERESAKRDYIRSLEDYWVAYYNLRILTLYDFVLNEKIWYENPMLTEK